MFKISYILKNISFWNTKTIQLDEDIYDIIFLKTKTKICLKYKFLKSKQFYFNEDINDYVFSYQPSIEFLDFKKQLNTYAKNKKYIGDLEHVNCPADY